MAKHCGEGDIFEEIQHFIQEKLGVDINDFLKKEDIDSIKKGIDFIIDKWDLKATILDSIPSEESGVTAEDMACLGTALQGAGLIDIGPGIQSYLDKLENAELNIAVTGESGAGKSSFINAIRGIRNGGEGAAKTAETETTPEPIPYAHPSNPNIKYWDLPGTGTRNFSGKAFLKKVNFQKYDFFIIISSERFRQNDVMLANEIKKMDKKFFFVRSKTDIDMESCEERDGPEFDAERSLRCIREYCERNLKEAGIKPLGVFLTSSAMKHRGKYDFKRLIETMENELPSIKRHAFLLSMPDHSSCLLQKKKKKMQWKIWLYSIVACSIQWIPIPLIPLAINFALEMKVKNDICKNFNLDDKSLTRLAKNADIPVEELKAVMKSSNENGLSLEKVVTGLCFEVLQQASLSVSKCITNSPIASFCISYIFTSVKLQMFLNEMAEDAERVQNKVSELREIGGEGKHSNPQQQYCL